MKNPKPELGVGRGWAGHPAGCRTDGRAISPARSSRRPLGPKLDGSFEGLLLTRRGSRGMWRYRAPPPSSVPPTPAGGVSGGGRTHPSYAPPDGPLLAFEFGPTAGDRPPLLSPSGQGLRTSGDPAQPERKGEGFFHGRATSSAPTPPPQKQGSSGSCSLLAASTGGERDAGAGGVVVVPTPPPQRAAEGQRRSTGLVPAKTWKKTRNPYLVAGARILSGAGLLLFPPPHPSADFPEKALPRVRPPSRGRLLRIWGRAGGLEGGDGVEEACYPPSGDPGEGTVTRGKALSNGEKVQPLEPVLCKKRPPGEGGSGVGQQLGKNVEESVSRAI